MFDGTPPPDREPDPPPMGRVMALAVAATMAVGVISAAWGVALLVVQLFGGGR